jgi:hypothetical protein
LAKIGEVTLPGGARITLIEKKVERTREDLDLLRSQITHIAIRAVQDNVTAMNKFVIEKPMLGNLWQSIRKANLKKEELEEAFYIYVFLDTFQMLEAFNRATAKTDEAGSKIISEMFQIWKDSWLPDLLKSPTAQKMLRHRLDSYYSPELQKVFREAAEKGN